MNTQTGISLKLSRVIKADPETVFQAWTEPEQLKQWSAPEGMTVPLAEMDLTVGGRYHIRMRNDEGKEFNAFGVYREIDPPKRLCYTWRWQEEEHDAGETLITVDFNDLGGSTEVVITHDLFPTVEAKTSHEEGWSSCLNRLEKIFD
jgi:uncharacterized protein YndB with AHSA1/START domain